jgi:hypothetical protein
VPGVVFDTLVIALVAIGFRLVPFFAKTLANPGLPVQGVVF